MNNITLNKEENNDPKKDMSFNFFSFIKFLYILLSFYFIMILFAKMKEVNTEDSKKYIDLDKYETNFINRINNHNLWLCSRMWGNQKEFLNGVVRKFKPKKVLEIGVAEGGSSIIILNAIKDIKHSHLFSIDLITKNHLVFSYI